MKSVGRTASPRFHPAGSPPFPLHRSSSPLAQQSQLRPAAESFLPVSGKSFVCRQPTVGEYYAHVSILFIRDSALVGVHATDLYLGWTQNQTCHIFM